jgi:dihydroorotate dehydrogenase (fumarate)
VVKNLLAGANAVQIATILYKEGPNAITEMNNSIMKWMEEHHLSSIRDFIGKLSYAGAGNPALYERAQFMKYFHGLGK